MPWKLGLTAVIFAGLVAVWMSDAPITGIATAENGNASSRPTSVPNRFAAFWFSVDDDAADQAADDAAVPELDPTTPLLIEPKTPDKIFDAVLLMLDLGRLRLAKGYLQKFLAAEPTDDELMAIRQEHGPAVFLKLSNLESLQPESLQLLDLISEATTRATADPARMSAMIQELQREDSVERRAAIQQLRVVGPRVIPFILASLGEASVAEREALLSATGELGDGVIAPLVAATDTDQPLILNFAIDALGQVGTPDILPNLWFFATSPDVPAGTRHSALLAISRIMNIPPHRSGDLPMYGVADGLRKLARSHYREMTLGVAVGSETIAHWRWDDESQTVVPVEMTIPAAKLLDGRRYARQALALTPQERDAQVLFLSLALASDAMIAGWGQPLPEGPGTAHNLALASGPELVRDVLTLAMNEGNAPVAAAALDVLKNIGSRHQLGGHAGQPSAILSALNYPDPRVQFAAANAVMHLDPTTPYRGAQRVVHIFARALVDSGTAGAVIVDADFERAGKLKAFLADMKFDAVAVRTGKEGFTQASDRMDVELILLHVNTVRWPLGQTLANLRADARTASLPIIVYGEESYRAKIMEQLKSYPNSTFISGSASLDDFEFQVKPFLASRRTPPLSAEQRQAMREAAVYWLAHIATGRRTEIYDLAVAEDALFAAVEDPALTRGVILAVGAIPTQSAQNELAEFVLNQRLTNEQRELAALQLVFHIQRFSMTLSDAMLADIAQVYIQTDNPGLKTALTALQGSLNPTTDQVGERLKQFQSTLPIPVGITPPAPPEEEPPAEGEAPEPAE